MFNFVSSKRIVVTIILAIVSIPFALFGIDYYFRIGDQGDQVARVAGVRISQQEFGQALRQRQEQMQKMMGGNVDPSILESPALRRAVLNQLVDERILYSAALKSHIVISDAELQSVIMSIPAFKDGNGKFSAQRYKSLVNAQGMTEASFEASVRKDLALNRARQAFAASAFMPNAVVDRLYRVHNQQREVSQHIIQPAQFTAQVKATPEEVKAYYDSHKQQFELPEKVKLQYVILSLEWVQKQVQITPEELQNYFKTKADQLAQPEQRRASHILVTVAPNATAEQKAKAEQKAETLLAEAKKSPNSFADLAKKNSEDPGSAREGGDLGFFARGKMVKPFDDAVFSMKTGDIVGPVQTQFGYHIIKLEAIRAAEGPKFEAIKGKLEDELRKSKAGRVYAQDAEELSNLVYDQPESLQPVVDKFKLQPQTSGWITRQGGDFPLLNNDKLLRAVFSDSVLKRKQNTDAIEVAPNMLIAARVVEYEPAKQRTLAEVQATIAQVVVQRRAAELAKKEGESLLAKLRKGEPVDLTWSPPQLVTRERREGLDPEGAQAVFRADAAKLPAYVGFEASGGRFVLCRISNVVEPQQVDSQQRKSMAQQLTPMIGQETLEARLANLRQNADVKINEKMLERSGG